MKKLLQLIIDQYELSPTGTHGISHWARVLENGRILCQETGANLKVVEHFAILHDSRRFSEARDEDHGKRSAEFVMKLQSKLELSKSEILLLATACRVHNNVDTRYEYDITLETCWDSDRLDLARVGHIPDKERLFTEAAKNDVLIDACVRKGFVEELPSLVKREWGINFRPQRDEMIFLDIKRNTLDDFLKRKVCW